MSSSEEVLRLALLGANIQKTRLPKLLGVLCRKEGLALEFQLMDSALDPDFDFHQSAQGCATAGYDGIVITHPFKTLTMELAQSISGVPVALGAGNCLRFDASGWVASNTDFTGLTKAWRAQFGNAEPGRVAMAGAGGVARSIAFALKDLGAQQIDIYDIDAQRSRDVAAASDPTGTTVQAVDAEAFRAAVRSADGLVNATPLGMAQYPGIAFEPADIGSQQWVFEAVYTPIATPFMQAAAAAGLQRLTGFELFLHMGMDTFAFFTGRDVDRTAVLPELRGLAPAD